MTMVMPHVANQPAQPADQSTLAHGFSFCPMVIIHTVLPYSWRGAIEVTLSGSIPVNLPTQPSSGRVSLAPTQ